MNIALFAAPGLWSPLHDWLRRFLTGQLFTPATQHPNTRNALPMRDRATCERPLKPLNVQHIRRRPLRIVRIVETGQSPSLVGRMVISGRMADVCAELDRLAACEKPCNTET